MFFRANPWKANSQTHNGVLPMKLNSSIAKLFDTLDEAVIAAGNGKIIYANTSAENLFGGRLQDAKALDRFDPLLLDTPGDIVYGSVRRGNEFLPAAAVTLGALRIITVSFPPEDSASRDLSALCPHLNTQLGVSTAGLAVIKMKLQKLRVHAADENLARVSKSLHSLSRVVSNYSLLFGDKIHRNDQLLDLVTLLTDVAVTANYLLAGTGVELVCSPQVSDCLFTGDQQLIERMVLNLVSNSIKFSEHGGKITLNVYPWHDGSMIEVSDGGGASRPMFTRFKQGYDIKDPEAGVGLGLPVVQRIAAMYDGNVVASVTNTGTRMLVFLPSTPHPLSFNDYSTAISDTDPLEVFLTELADVLSYSSFMREDI